MKHVLLCLHWYILSQKMVEYLIRVCMKMIRSSNISIQILLIHVITNRLTQLQADLTENRC